jgi:tetratricopeptide (TPR) repeat protein
VTTPNDPLERNAILRRVAVAALLICALMLSFFHIVNLDIGGHITVGREIIKTHAIPSTEFFSHTSAGHPYPVHQWLGEIILFGVDHLLGVPGLIVLRMAIVLLGALLLYRNARREGAPVVVAVAVALLLLTACRPRFLMRPFLVTLVFLPLLGMWLAELRDGKTRRLWPVMLLMAVWGHIHSGVLFGVLFLLATFVGEGLKLVWAGRRTASDRAVPGSHVWPGTPLDGWNYRRLLGFGAAAIVLPFATMALVNPSGLKPLILPFLFFRNNAFTSMIAEYHTVNVMKDWPFDLVAGAVLLGILLRPRRVDLTQLLLVTGFGILAYQAVRGILPFAAVAAPLLGRTWGSLADDLLARVARGRGRPGARAARANAAEAISILLVIAVAMLLSIQAARSWAFPFGFGKDPRAYPERALDFLWSQNIRGPIFNTDLFASSLLWRGHGKRFPVFVDARLEAYPETFWKDVYYRVLQTVPGWDDVLDRYGVRCAMVRRKPGEIDDSIGNALWADPRWGLVYWNDVVMIFVKRGADSARNDEVLSRWEFTSFSPRTPQAVTALRGEAMERAELELSRLVAWEPKAFLTRWTWAAALTGVGRREEAAALFDDLAGTRDARDNPAFSRSRAAAELVAGHRDGWERYLAEAGSDPGSADERFDAAQLAARTGETEIAVGLYRDVLAARPKDADAMNNLALVLARSGNTADAAGLADEALRLAPEDPYFIATRGEVRFHAGDRAGALADFRSALQRLPAGDGDARKEVMHWILRLE